MSSKKDKESKAPPSIEKYKNMKKRLREVLEENEFLAKKLLKKEKKIMALEEERDKLLERLERDGSSSSNDSSGNSSDSDSGSSSGSKRRTDVKEENNAKDAQNNKRRRPLAGNVRRIQRYPVDELGRPQLPIVVGVITILELGTIVWDRPAYHSERYIYPVGFKSSRQYLSIVDPNATVTYTCTIVEAGDAPKFVVTPEDAPDRAAVGNSATGAWATIVKTAHQLRNREHAGGASGPDFFGLSQGVVIKLIQDVPGARQCKNYIWQEFEYISGRGAKRLLRPGEEAPPSSKRSRKPDAPSGTPALPSSSPFPAPTAGAPAISSSQPSTSSSPAVHYSTQPAAVGVPSIQSYHAPPPMQPALLPTPAPAPAQPQYHMQYHQPAQPSAYLAQPAPSAAPPVQHGNGAGHSEESESGSGSSSGSDSDSGDD